MDKLIKYREDYYPLYNPNKPIKCLIVTYYKANKQSNFFYAYKIEYLPILSN